MNIKKDFLSKNDIIIFAFVLSAFFLYLNFFNNLGVPNSDFFAFRENALSYLDFKLPSSLKREPLFPLTIGLVSIMLQSSIIFAAQITNLILSLINCYFVYRISKVFLGRAAFFPALLFSMNPTTVFMVAQPILETMLVSTILITIYFSIQNSKWSYLAAFFVSLIRYEAVLLIPILVFNDFIINKKRLRAVSLGSLSSIGILVWMALSITRYSSNVNPYVGQLSLGLGERRFLYNSINAIFDFLPNLIIKNIPFKILASAIIVLILVGLISSIKQSVKLSFTLICFFIAYFLIHVLYPSINAPLRYVLPILWVYYIFIFKGIQSAINLLGRKSKRGNSFDEIFDIRFSKSIAFFSCFGLIILNLFILNKVNYDDQMLLKLSYGLYVLTILIFFISPYKKGNMKNPLVLTALFFLVISFVGVGINEANSGWEKRWKYYRAHQRKVAEWYIQVAKDGDKMAVSEPGIMIYYSRLNPEYFVPLKEFNSKTTFEFLKELRAKQVRYVVWDKQYMHYARKPNNAVKKRFGTRLMSYLFDPEVTSQMEVMKEIYVGEKNRQKKAIIFKLNNVEP